MAFINEEVSNQGLLKFSESCVLTPSMLARRLRLDDSTIEQIQFAHPNDRHEQIYQMLSKWKMSHPKATWEDLQEATDSGVKRALKDLYSEDHANEVNCNNSTGLKPEELVDAKEEIGPPPQKMVRESSPIPSAPPYELVYPVQEMGEHYNSSDRLSLDSETDSRSSSRNGSRINSSSSGSSQTEGELTYDDDYLTVIDALGHETHWFELGLALKLKPSLLDEIKVTNREKVADCRKEMVKEWLKNPKYKPSWRTLCSALKEDLVGNKGLANKIAQKYNII